MDRPWDDKKAHRPPKRITPQVRAAFGQEVRTLRLAVGLTQNELAALCGVHPTYIGLVERGKRGLSAEFLIELAFRLGQRPSQLMERLELLTGGQPK